MGVYQGDVSLGNFGKGVAQTVLLQVKPKEARLMGDSLAPLGVCFGSFCHMRLAWIGRE